MHEWLEALRKSAKATSEGVQSEEVRRAETECGVPFPEDLADLYQALNGGEFQGEVRLYPLRGGEGAPSVLEKSRLMVVGLPAAGVWRFGLKGAHRHLFVARKSAMEEQGDGGGPLPGWVDALDGDDWVFGTWDGEKKEMRLYRALKDMLEVLVPPVEEVESFGERTFARAMNAVLQGALSGAAAQAEDDEGAPVGRGRDYSSDLAALAREAGEEDEEAEVSGEEELEEELAEDTGEEEAEGDEQGELFEKPEPKRPAAKKARGEEATPVARETPPEPARKSPRKGAAKKAAAPEAEAPSEAGPTGAGARKAAGKKTAAKKAAPPRGAAKKAAPPRGAAKKAVGKATAKKAAPARGAAKKATGKAAAKKGAAQKRGAAVAKKGAAQKRGATTAKKSAAAKKGAVQKRGATTKKAATKKAPAKAAAKKAPARKSAAKKPSRRRS
ncbi:SMI1/KNR4 family protein [Corallococcus carmarthensis]|uniref:SMI1/KNR4 family protein n=1 Tax=Corallococcus carmarthensis TaxID=2316728 RepID=A0A3A8KCG6_9BACT|nr:SMI1/KNR4 family protein [Corallococcus carmarthensis]RKH02035.1 SMI1/KNR4 family protein [Corallococcus carmarthensis]